MFDFLRAQSSNGHNEAPRPHEIDVCLSPKRWRTMRFCHSTLLHSLICYKGWICDDQRSDYNQALVSQHCLALLWRQTNIEITWDLSTLWSQFAQSGSLMDSQNAKQWSGAIPAHPETLISLGFLSSPDGQLNLSSSWVLAMHWGYSSLISQQLACCR